VSTAIALNSHAGSETVCQPFVKLFAIHYGLTFCLYMRSLYDASLGPSGLHSPSRLIRLSDSYQERIRNSGQFRVLDGRPHSFPGTGRQNSDGRLNRLINLHSIYTDFATVAIGYRPK